MTPYVFYGYFSNKHMFLIPAVSAFVMKRCGHPTKQEWNDAKTQTVH